MNIIIVILIIITITIIIMTKASPTLSVLVIGLLNVEHLPRLAFSLSSNVLSVACKVKLVRVFIVNVQMRKVQMRTLGKRDSSSRIARIPSGFSNMVMQDCRSIPKSTSKQSILKTFLTIFSLHTISQSIPSFRYSSCSSTNLLRKKGLVCVYARDYNHDKFII